MKLQDYFDKQTGGDDAYADPTTVITPQPVGTQPYTPTGRPGLEPVGSPQRAAPPTGYQSGTDYWSQDKRVPGDRYASNENVGKAFQTYLGRPFDVNSGGNPWANDPNYESNIYNSEEAYNYRQKPSATSSGSSANLQQLWNDWWAQGGRAKQSDPNSLKPFVDYANSKGANISLAAPASGGYVKGVMQNGVFTKLLDGYDNPTYLPGGDTMESPAASTGVRSGGGGTEFTDPWASAMESLTGGYIGSLLTPPNRTALNAYVQDLLARKEASKGRAQQFATSMGDRVTDLRGPAYTDQQLQALKTGATDSLERRRQETLKNEREKVYQRGFEPTSGIVRDAENTVNNRFDESRTGIESDLLRSEIDATRSNQRYADSLEGIIQRVLEGGDLDALQSSAAIADIENKRQQDDLARQQAAIGATSGPLQLINQRLGLADNTLALSNPASATGSVLQLLNLLNGTNAQNSAMSNQNNYALAQLLSILLG